jgi:hypothetical protein
LLPVMALLCLILFAGCAGGLWEEDPPSKILTIHELTSEARDTETFVMILEATDSTPSLWLRRIPVLHSKYIEAMEVVRGTRGMVGLRCYLDQHGRYLWTQIRTMYAGRTLAVLVDRELAFMWKVPARGEDFAKSIVLEGPWNRSEAAAVAAQARRNYELMN